MGWWVSQAAAMSSPTPSAQSHQHNYSCMDEASHLLNRVSPRYVTYLPFYHTYNTLKKKKKKKEEVIHPRFKSVLSLHEHDIFD